MIDRVESRSSEVRTTCEVEEFEVALYAEFRVGIVELLAYAANYWSNTHSAKSEAQPAIGCWEGNTLLLCSLLQLERIQILPERTYEVFAYQILELRYMDGLILHRNIIRKAAYPPKFLKLRMP